jgi:hypothetical protein
MNAVVICQPVAASTRLTPTVVVQTVARGGFLRLLAGNTDRFCGKPWKRFRSGERLVACWPGWHLAGLVADGYMATPNTRSRTALGAPLAGGQGKGRGLSWRLPSPMRKR